MLFIKKNEDEKMYYKKSVGHFFKNKLEHLCGGVKQLNKSITIGLM